MTEEDIGIVVVDDDEGFLDETKRALDGKVPTVRFLTDVQRRIDDGSTSVVVLGPSFASEPAMESAAILGEDNEDLGIILVAAEIEPSVLRAAMRAGVRDVIEPPLTEQRLNDAVAPLRRRRPAV
jgi:FixJ family two-component response regulator